jgi:hypothetical protein
MRILTASLMKSVAHRVYRGPQALKALQALKARVASVDLSEILGERGHGDLKV